MNWLNKGFRLFSLMKRFLTPGILLPPLISFAMFLLCLTLFVIWVVHMFSKRKHAANGMKGTRFDVGNGRLVDFSYFCKHDFLIALAHA